ncbi:AfsR/SARP family transcriptional regulator [Planobispora longispora]|nr:BTAD domain-containing putative transcriptional regulator [Planobispora longispora]
MRFGVLGPLAVWTDGGEPVAVPGLKVRALLADLLVHEGRPVPADRLIHDLWGDDLPGNPPGALSAKVSQLRRVLEDAEPGGRELVVHQPAGYLLKGVTDADGFHSLIAEAGRAGDPRARAALLSEALTGWRGPAFADFADEAFTRAAAVRLAEQRLAAQEDWAEARLALGEHAPLAGDLGDLLTEHPLRERLRAAHMIALYRAGRQSEALESYEALRALLADELGLDPSPGLVALHRAILTQDPGLAAPAVRDAGGAGTAGSAASGADESGPGGPDRPVPESAGPAPATAGPATAGPATAGPATVRPATNLPAPVTGLVGREEAVAEVCARLETDRLVTLTGPGGVGKTRLALAAAGRLIGPPSGSGPSASSPEFSGGGAAHDSASARSTPFPVAHDSASARSVPFPDGVWLVELAALDRPAERDAVPRVAEAVMAVLGVRDGGDPTGPGAPVTAADRLVEALRSRLLLLVLDNCEHVVEPVAELVESLLRAAPGVRLLATSQEPLALPGEVVWNVPPLEVPARAAGPRGTHDPRDLADLGRIGSVRLFVARASAADRGFTLDADTAPAVAVLCRRLDGIPLALELAATRVRALGVHGLVDRLDDRFRLLATGYRGAPPRQRTLMAMIDWSWELLTDPERVVLRRLAVHADGCALEAAEAVCAGDDLPAADVLDLLTRLVDRSLVVMVETAEGPRYRLLESVAAYCAERVREAGEDERMRRRHRRHYTALAERAGQRLYGHEQRRWLRVLDAEAANMRAALTTAVADGDADGALRLVGALAWYWFLRGRLGEARRSFAAALAAAGVPGAVARSSASPAGGSADVPSPSEARAEAPVTGPSPGLLAGALAWDAGIGFLHGDVADREERRRTVMDRYEEAGDPGGRARAEWFLAYTGIDLGDLAVAGELLDRALPVFERLGDRWGTAAVLAARAKLAHVRGDLEVMRRDGGRSAEIFAELGDRWGRLEATGWLGGLAEMTGDLEGAERLQRDGLHLAEELGLWAEVAGRLGWLGWIALQRGDYAEAMDLCERALRLFTEQGHQAGRIFALMGLAFAARRNGEIDRAEVHLREVLEQTPRDDAGDVPPPYLPMIMTELGFAAEERGDAAAALALHLEALDLVAKMDASRDVPITLDGLAGALALAGCHDRAARLLGAAAAIRASSSIPISSAERDDVDRITARVRDALGGDLFAAESGRGAALTPEEARSLAAQPGPGAAG